MSPYRTIRYVLGGAPQNMADCVDYARKHHVSRVIVELRVREQCTEKAVYNELFCLFVWIYDDRAVNYEEIFGACYQHEEVKRQHDSIDETNRRFLSTLDNIRTKLGNKLAGDIEGSGKRFPYTLCYDKGKK